MSDITVNEVKTAIKVMKKLNELNDNRIMEITFDGIINILNNVLEEVKNV